MASIPVVEERLFHFCRNFNVGNYYATVSVAALQAVENAIVHGNRSDVSKQVSLTFGTCRGGIFVSVHDEGEGFDYNQFGNLPDDDSSLGKGIFIMRSLADGLSFSDHGRCVRLEFDVAGIDPADALGRISLLKEHFDMVAA